MPWVGSAAVAIAIAIALATAAAAPNLERRLLQPCLFCHMSSYNKGAIVNPAERQDAKGLPESFADSAEPVSLGKFDNAVKNSQ